MPVKNSKKQVDVNARWIQKRGENFRHEQEDNKDKEYNHRQQIAERIKTAEIKPKKIYKAKLEDDMRAYEYVVVKVDRQSGEVSLKNEKGTVRNLNVLDGLFGEREEKKHKWI